MAVPLPRKPKLRELSKLQALLLLGGAFVLLAIGWTVSRDRLVRDLTTQAPDGAVFALQLLPKDSDPSSGPAWQAFVSALPTEAKSALGQAKMGPGSVLFATRTAAGDLKWDAMTPGHGGSPWQLFPKSADAEGFIVLDGRATPLTAVFAQDKAIFNVGRTYRGLSFPASGSLDRRRMTRPLQPSLAYLEKPSGANWSGPTSALTQEMQRFTSLPAFFRLPGRVELSVSASHTAETLQPFVLYYRPALFGSDARGPIEAAAKNLLAEAVPHEVSVKLPDGTSMQEQRLDKENISVQEQKNRFGVVVKYAFQAERPALYAFYSNDGESWLSTDLSLIQSIILDSVGQSPASDACQADTTGGFADFPGGVLPIANGFSRTTISVHDLETGVFTFCGYYGH